LHLPVWLCRLVAVVLGAVMARPPLTLSGIAGVVNDADLDPELAMRELGYAPLGARAGFERCFAGANSPARLAASPGELVKGSGT
jgi:NADH dehydrogenase